MNDQEELDIIHQLKVAKIKARTFCGAWRIPLDKEEREELAGLALVEAMRSFDEDKGSWDWWLFIWVRRLIIDYMRSWWLGPRKGKDGYVPCNWERLEDEVNVQHAHILPYIKEKADALICSDRIEERIAAKEIVHQVMQELDRTKWDNQTRRFKMHIIDGKDYEDIAKEEEVSKNCVMTQISRVRSNLRRVVDA